MTKNVLPQQRLKSMPAASLTEPAQAGAPKLRHQPPARHFWESVAVLYRRRTSVIAGFAALAILVHLAMRFGLRTTPGAYNVPLLATFVFGGMPLVYELLKNVVRREFGSDLLAGISIVTSVLLHEYLAGAIVVLMLSGGEALENYALRNASSVLQALAKRMPAIAHRKRDSVISDVALDDIEVGDTLVIYPHDISPVDGTVIDGHGVMNEAFLTGEPFEITKAPGSTVISGAVNGASALTITASRRAVDSRYAKIMEVMRESEQNQPHLRRLGDQLGAIYTPVAVSIAVLAWIISGEAVRFLAVLVIATPCPLLIAIPVSIIGSISLAARRSIIVKNPAVLEQITSCRTAIFDKTGTLTYGEPKLTEQLIAPGFAQKEVLTLAASLELYSKHPLARAILAAATSEGLRLQQASRVSEPPGQGLRGTVGGQEVQITSRGKLITEKIPGAEHGPPIVGGLECIIVIDGRFAAAFRFRDAPRAEGRSFIKHLGPKHQFQRVMILSGDRESEVRYLAEEVGISEIHAEQSPEQKLTIVRQETGRAKTLYVGDGINDAPAMMAATVGMAIGQNSDVTAEAADVVAMENSLKKVDEFMHISHRMRSIALQSAVGGMLLSFGGMMFAAVGYLAPVAGAVSQEIIDVLAVLNALRGTFPPKLISDIAEGNKEE
jgi:heavy metal translocating P-type ATPase